MWHDRDGCRNHCRIGGPRSTKRRDGDWQLGLASCDFCFSNLKITLFQGKIYRQWDEFAVVVIVVVVRHVRRARARVTHAVQLLGRKTRQTCSWAVPVWRFGLTTIRGCHIVFSKTTWDASDLRSGAKINDTLAWGIGSGTDILLLWWAPEDDGADSERDKWPRSYFAFVLECKPPWALFCLKHKNFNWCKLK